MTIEIPRFLTKNQADLVRETEPHLICIGKALGGGSMRTPCSICTPGSGEPARST